jgi:hypothetical protein
MRCDGKPVRLGMRTTRQMSRASQPDKQNGTLSVHTIKASGHVHRSNRPNTRLRPTTAPNHKISPCNAGAIHTGHSGCTLAPSASSRGSRNPRLNHVGNIGATTPRGIPFRASTDVGGVRNERWAAGSSRPCCLSIISSRIVRRGSGSVEKAPPFMSHCSSPPTTTERVGRGSAALRDGGHAIPRLHPPGFSVVYPDTGQR